MSARRIDNDGNIFKKKEIMAKKNLMHLEALTEKLKSWFSQYVNPELDGSVEDVRGAGQITSHSFC